MADLTVDMTMKRSLFRRAGQGLLAWALLAGLPSLVKADVAISLAKEPAADIRHDATVGAIEKVLPSVVNIATSRIVEYRDFYDELRREFFGQPPLNQPRTQEQLDNLG